MSKRPKLDENDENPKIENEHVDYSVKDAFRILESQILNDGFANDQIQSFTDFVNQKIPICFSEHPPVIVTHDATNRKHTVELLNVRYDRPSVTEADGRKRYVTPHECHIRRATYQMIMYVSARYIIQDRTTNDIIHTVEFRDKEFDFIPVMKSSEYCTSATDPEIMMEDELECGGYYISTGAEKVVIGQEGPRDNYPFVTQETDGSIKCEYRSFNSNKFRSTSTLKLFLTPNNTTDDMEERKIINTRITVQIPFAQDVLPVCVVFKLLGIQKVEDMMTYICCDSDEHWFQQSVFNMLIHDLDAVVTMTHEDAVTNLVHDRGQTYNDTMTGYIKKRKAEKVETIAAQKRRKRYENETEYERAKKQVSGLISSEFLPHQGYLEEDVGAKTVEFGVCVRKMMQCYVGLQQLDDRDHYMHRRVSQSGMLMPKLFRKQLTMWRKRIAAQIKRELDNGGQFINVKDLLKSNIGQHLQIALSTGNFSMKRGPNNMDGVGQVLSRTENCSAISHIARSNNPMNKDGRAINVRLQDASCTGIIDPWDTPEGQSCGLMRNKAFSAGVRIGYPNDVLIRAVVLTGMVDVATKNDPLVGFKSCRVYVSGTLIGTCNTDPKKFLNLLRAKRACADLPHDVSIYITTGKWKTSPLGEIHVNGDSGSYYWCLIRVDKMHKLRHICDSITNEDALWPTLIKSGIIEKINKDEEVTTVRVAMDYHQLKTSKPGTYTHMVIHPIQICSLYTSRNPFFNLNQSPRTTYAAAMGKQRIGPLMTNHPFRCDTAATHGLWYPQRALISTFTDRVVLKNQGNSCQNIVLDICSEAYNIEDSLVFNQQSIDRGLFRSSVIRTTREVVRQSPNESETLEIPPEECRSKLYSNYNKINPKTGYPEPGTIIEENDVIVSKVARITKHFKVTETDGQINDMVEETTLDRSQVFKVDERTIIDDVVITSTLDGAQSVRVKQRAMRVPEVGDKFACLTESHEVLTDRGWIDIKYVTCQHKVAVFNNGIVYQHPTHTHVYEVENEPMIKLMDEHYHQEMTFNHRVPYVNTKGIVELQRIDNLMNEIGQFHVLTQVSSGLVKDGPQTLQMIWLCDQGEKRQDWIRLIATLNYAFTLNDQYEYCFDYNKFPACPQDMKGLCENVGISNWSDDDQKCFHECFTFIGEKKRNGKLFDVALELPQEDALLYLKTYLGIPDPTSTECHIQLNTIQEGNELCVLATHAGLLAAQINAYQMVTFYSKKWYQTQIDSTKCFPIKYTGKVYCLTLPKTEIFCVRKNGKITWTGNSRHGQKGTIGAVFKQTDMPYNPKTGITADAILNPHAIPSRMTIGHLLEMVLGKIAALSGEEIDGTAFVLSDKYKDCKNSDQIINDAGEMLKELGFEVTCEEGLIDGRTGLPLKHPIFRGVIAYAKLKHLVISKIHARSRGPKQMQTQQPVEGRHRQGGQRFGEMERDNFIAHGVSGLLNERLLESSDKAYVPICEQCGEIAQPPKKLHEGNLHKASVYANKGFCRKCMSSDHVVCKKMPYAYKLSVQELAGLQLKATMMKQQ